jgi:codanin-1
MSVQTKETHRVTGSEHGASDVGIDRGIPLLLNDVTHKEELNKLALKYIQHMKSSHVANVGSSLQQLMRLLTLSNDLKMWKEFKDEENQTEGSSVPLRTLSNCCYFMAKVLEGNKDLLLLFAKETLHVLSVNPRLSEMSPQLKMWLEETCIAKSAEYEEVPSSESSSVFGVTFDSERDGKENFPSDKAFNAFRRQRDAFYDLYQQWRSLTDLNRDELVAKRARAILMMEGVCSQAALAQLFLLQLMKSCTSKDPSQGVDDSLTESLKQADPTKLKKLTERFTGPLQRGSRQVKRFFDGEEEFFYKFLVYSDSYNFSENLKCILVAEVHKMNNPSILYGSPRDYQITVHKLQLLIKFLGLIVCQPYKDTTAGVSDWGRAKGRCASEVLAYPINVKSALQSALREHHVLLTLPWVVGYLVAMGLGQERREDETLTDVLNILFGLLRTCSQNQILGSRGQFLIILSIGYLIENQGFMTLYRASLEKEVDPVIKEWAATFASSKGCLDSLNIVTSKVLNLCSPVFDEVHSILVQFSIGHKVPPTPARKIKPVPVFPALFGGERSKTKEEELIEEAFMASQPTFVKQLCDVVATRLAANMESACKEHIIPCAVQSGLHQMADVVRKKLEEKKLLSEDTPTTSVDFLNQVTYPLCVYCMGCCVHSQ